MQILCGQQICVCARAVALRKRAESWKKKSHGYRFKWNDESNKRFPLPHTMRRDTKPHIYYHSGRVIGWGMTRHKSRTRVWKVLPPLVRYIIEFALCRPSSSHWSPRAPPVLLRRNRRDQRSRRLTRVDDRVLRLSKTSSREESPPVAWDDRQCSLLGNYYK